MTWTCPNRPRNHVKNETHVLLTRPTRTTAHVPSTKGSSTSKETHEGTWMHVQEVEMVRRTTTAGMERRRNQRRTQKWSEANGHTQTNVHGHERIRTTMRDPSTKKWKDAMERTKPSPRIPYQAEVVEKRPNQRKTDTNVPNVQQTRRTTPRDDLQTFRTNHDASMERQTQSADPKDATPTGRMQDNERIKTHLGRKRQAT
mmetsp:Transcript_4756/g.30091  ORF Transcript_4756/g.30091 Transcript_4756/m.30091 type:complete len:201 (+) Transcript_4756:136-738(+)